MLNTLWLGFFLTAALAALSQWLVGGNSQIFAAMVEALFSMARLSVEVMVLLFGTLTLWLGFLRIAERAGIGVEAVNFEHVIYEGFAPHQVAVMVECLTDNVKRTAPEMRVLFRKGQMGTSGSVAWDFDHVGMIEAEPVVAGTDPEEAAIEAGAQDCAPGDEDGHTTFWTDPADLDLVSRALPAHGFTVLSAKLGYKPKNPVNPANLSAEQLEEVEAFLAAIDANDDVQNVYVSLGG